eukprot:5851473-Ditylum_brightwellii.AAC.1
MSNEELERSGWKECPIRYCNASTIHEICGDTLRKGAAQISSDPKLKYYLWGKGLATVLVT